MPGLRAALSGLTLRGRCLLAAGLALGLCAASLGQRDLLRVAVFLTALPLAAVTLVARTRYRLSCTRRVEPSRVQAGEPATARLRLDNVSRLPSGLLLVEDALPYTLGTRPRFVLERVEAGARRDVTYTVRSDLRGRYRIGPLSVRLTDPFGLCELSRAFTTTDTLVITPVVTALPTVRLGGEWSGGGDSAGRSIAASGSDDAATREYRHGDDLRKVHWRSTARVGELMVRREEQPFQSRATLLLDSRADAHRGEGPASSFEWAVSALASIAVSLARSGFTLALVRDTGDDLTPHGVPVTEGVVLDALATVAPSRGQSLEGAGIRIRHGRSGGSGGGLASGAGGILVAVLGTMDLADAARVARYRQGAATCVAVLLDTDSWAPLPGRPRQQAVRNHEAVNAVLAGAGWRVLPVSHGTTLASVWPGAGSRPLAERVSR
ncbi:MAG: DUF58 domain-containing protein [Actinomycetota bacterium]|nr:DUF58 domain-containing protein [Actinomycetota bacterium]